MSGVVIEPTEHACITEEWLKNSGFKWHQFGRQPEKHWVLWLGDAIRGDGLSLTSFENPHRLSNVAGIMSYIIPQGEKARAGIPGFCTCVT